MFCIFPAFYFILPNFARKDGSGKMSRGKDIRRKGRETTYNVEENRYMENDLTKEYVVNPYVYK